VASVDDVFAGEANDSRERLGVEQRERASDAVGHGDGLIDQQLPANVQLSFPPFAGHGGCVASPSRLVTF
jgi:hypothetical protein